MMDVPRAICRYCKKETRVFKTSDGDHWTSICLNEYCPLHSKEQGLFYPIKDVIMKGSFSI